MKLNELSKRAIEIRDIYSKIEKNKCGNEWSNSQIMQGFVGDVGDLMKLIMAKEGLREIDNVDEKLKHELADCLWSILVLSKKYNIDIEKEFLKTMNQIEKKLEN